MAVINRTKRYAATSEQQKILQRQIHAIAQEAQHKAFREQLQQANAKLERLRTLGTITDRNQLDNFITFCNEAVDRAMLRAQYADLESVLVIERVLEVR
jgi:hypothetical protein